MPPTDRLDICLESLQILAIDPDEMHVARYMTATEFLLYIRTNANIYEMYSRLIRNPNYYIENPIP